MRGILTKEVQKISKKLIGREITQLELRLIPYIHYLATNEQSVNLLKINTEERNILIEWKKEGFGEFGINTFLLTEEFWKFMCAILFQSYVKREGTLADDEPKEKES